MVVQHNLQAMNANRMLNVTTGSQAKSTEKLSSGYKINRAADDAAGLSISEKMRKQIRGLDQASSNAQDGISAVQTAEGALTEVHSMLQRMNELATQAANGTNSESDRESIQAEINQLTTEIDRVAETTKFNETYLLKGNTEGKTSTVNVNAHDAGLAGKLSESVNGKVTFTLDKKLEAGSKLTVAGEELTIGKAMGKEDYAKISDLNKTKVQIGDKITKADGTELNITDKATIKDVTTFIGTKAASTDVGELGKLTLADGTTYSFTGKNAANKIDVTTVSKDGTTSTKEVGTLTADSTFANIAGVTSIDLKGATFTTADGKETYQLETSLNRDELTLFDKSTGKAVTVAANGKMGTQDDTTVSTVLDLASNGGNGNGNAVDELAAGDTVTTVKTDATGNKVETTKTAFNDSLAKATDAVISRDELAEKLNKLAVGDIVRVGSYKSADMSGTVDYVDYTIAGSKDAENGYTITVDTLLSKIKEGDLVGFDSDTTTSAFDFAAANTFSVAGVESEEGTTSVQDAYKKIAEELAKASSIGADKEATVTSNGDGSFTITQGTVEVKDALSFSLHVGADSDMTNKINVDVDAMDAAGLGVKGINVKDISGMAATYAIDAIADAISRVSAQRSALGAVQNRLEHTIANVDNVVENTTSAESAIRDTDMAEEMVEYSKNNILAQAGQSMLAQANQSTQGVMSLLQ